jgi:hypothetical protein
MFNSIYLVRTVFHLIGPRTFLNRPHTLSYCTQKINAYEMQELCANPRSGLRIIYSFYAS